MRHIFFMPQCERTSKACRWSGSPIARWQSRWRDEGDPARGRGRLRD